MHTLIVSASLREASRSRHLACYAYEQLAAKKNFVDFLDLTQYDLPLCDGEKCYTNPLVKVVRDKIENATSIIIATPIYNFNVSSSIKNLIELTDKAWTNKVVGFICASGGSRSYMGALSLSNSLMLDFRCLIVPKYVFVDLTDLADSGKALNSDIEERIQELLQTTEQLGVAWQTIQKRVIDENI